MKSALDRFWKFYEAHHNLNVFITAFLFSLQLVHLYWLTTHVVALRLVGQSFFNLSGVWELLILVVDYTEIPALIATSLLYINEFRKGRNLRSLLFLAFLNSQWLHIFWITDEFVVDYFSGSASATILPFWLTWVAIGIDYLELPVIADTLIQAFRIALNTLRPAPLHAVQVAAASDPRCADVLNHTLRQYPGIQQTEFDPQTGRLNVAYDPVVLSDGRALSLIREAGRLAWDRATRCALLNNGNCATCATGLNVQLAEHYRRLAEFQPGLQGSLNLTGLLQIQPNSKVASRAEGV
ncbi:MAG: hypothetical protein IT330_16245 [Anaerolineae bacterium]|nr:hypothetical protein [Anaerolineae bacterium]